MGFISRLLSEGKERSANPTAGAIDWDRIMKRLERVICPNGMTAAQLNLSSDANQALDQALAVYDQKNPGHRNVPVEKLVISKNLRAELRQRYADVAFFERLNKKDHTVQEIMDSFDRQGRRRR